MADDTPAAPADTAVAASADDPATALVDPTRPNLPGLPWLLAVQAVAEARQREAEREILATSLPGW